MEDLYLEDFAVGDRFVTESESVSEEQIIRFAKEWDPQTFHTDPEAASRHEMGGLFASGLHTLGVTFRLFVKMGVIAASNVAGAGLDNLRWSRPVRPDDTLHVEIETTEVRPSRSRPDRGYVVMHYVTQNQHGDPVLEFDLAHIVRRRPTELAEAGE
jgi:acyl dehydratase